MRSIDREAQEIVKAAEHVTTVEQMHAVQREVAAEMKTMSPSDYHKLIDEVVGINAKDCLANPHLPHLFQIVQQSAANNRNIGFEFENQGAPQPDGTVAREMAKIHALIGRGGASSGEKVNEELKKAQQTMTIGEFRQLYLDAYDAEQKQGGVNPLSPVDKNWHFIPQKH